MEAESKIPQKTRRGTIPSRPTDGDLRRDRLKGADPTREYIYADPRQEQFGVADYSSRGYVVEKRRAGGVKPAVEPLESAEGSEIRQLGCVLMSRPKEAGEREFKAQQDYADAIDAQILKPGGVDGLRGVKGYIGVRNTSTSLERDEE